MVPREEGGLGGREACMCMCSGKEGLCVCVVVRRKIVSLR